jgi:hypothetical protein
MKSGLNRLRKGIASLAILAIIVFLLSGCVSINHLPVITSLKAEPELVAALGSCRIECIASDEDGDELSYEWLPSGGSTDGDGAVVAWDAPESGGTYDIMVKVSDGNGQEVSDSISVSVRVNHPPIITALTADPNPVVPSSSCQLRCVSEDADGDDLTYEWAREGGDISGEGSEVTWTAPGAVGTYTVTVVVTDGLGGESSSSLSINVGVNHPPVIEDLTITPEERNAFNYKKMKIYEGKSCDIECIASDPDGDQLTYEWSADVPPDVRDYWSAVGSISGEGPSVTWTAPSKLSEVAVTVTVSDGRGGRDTKTLVFHVVTCYCALNK